MIQPVISIVGSGDCDIGPPGGTVCLLLEPRAEKMTERNITMKKRVYGFSTFAAVLAALTLNGPATAREGVESKDFKGQSSGIITTVACNPVVPGVLCTHEVAKGEATQVKHFTLTGDARIDLTTGAVTETLTLTAANGDKLFLRMAALGIDQAHGLGIVAISGGTGEFQGATGYFVRFTTFVFPQGPPIVVPSSDVFDGIISFGREHE